MDPLSKTDNKTDSGEATPAAGVTAPSSPDTKPSSPTPETKDGPAALSASAEAKPADSDTVTLEVSADGKPTVMPTPVKKSKPKGKKFKPWMALVIFAIILLAAVGGLFILHPAKKAKVADTSIAGQNLTADQLTRLGTNSSLGDTGQSLTVNYDSDFRGKVIVQKDLGLKGNLTVAGQTVVGILTSGQTTISSLKVSGATSLGEITVDGTANFNGNAQVKNVLTVGSTLNVGGNASFGGTITAASVNFRGPLVLSNHLVTAGTSPSASGSNVGNGGTVSAGGNDIAGTVNINTGIGPAAGILASITFRTPYSSTPHVTITPIGSASATLQYYVTRTANGFVIGSNNAPPPSANIAFDYMVTQ